MAADGLDPDEHLEYRLLRLGERLRKRFDAALQSHGLTARQFSVLAVLAHRPGVTSAELARTVLTSPQGMAPVIEQLESRGLIAPRARRGRGAPAPTQLSDTGRLVLAEAAETVRRLDAETRQALGPALDAFAAALERLEEHLATPREGTG